MPVNNDYQRNSNMSHVFKAVWQNSQMSRIDIARKLELYRSTVTNIISSLIEHGAILEGETGNATEKGGRKPVYLSINKKFGAVIGIEIQMDSYNVSALAFDGTTLLNGKGTTPKTDKALSAEEKFIWMVDEIIKKVLPKINALSLPVLGITLGIPGIVDTDKGIIIRSDPYHLKNFDFGKILGSRYGLPLLVENDAKCCGWLQCAKNKNAEVKDYLCVLARSRNLNDKYYTPEIMAAGIGTGMSVVMNGKVVNGHNYAVGEYLSHSWRKDSKGQTGLSSQILSTIEQNDDSYRKWIIDMFETLTPVLALLEPCIIYLHGQQEKDHERISEIIKNDVSQFEEAAKTYGVELKLEKEDAYEISKGAAFMFIQKLFETPTFPTESYSHISWDKLFAIQKTGLTEKLMHEA